MVIGKWQIINIIKTIFFLFAINYVPNLGRCFNVDTSLLCFKYNKEVTPLSSHKYFNNYQAIINFKEGVPIKVTGR